MDIYVCACFLYSYVVNYDFPRTIEDYVHRVGRTGRAGRIGTCISYVNSSDWRMVPELIQILKKSGQTIPLGLNMLIRNVRNSTPFTVPVAKRSSLADFLEGKKYIPPMSNKKAPGQKFSFRN